MPYVSYEQRLVPMTYIFCAVVLASSGNDYDDDDYLIVILIEHVVV